MQLDAVLAMLGPARSQFTRGTGRGELTPDMVRGALGMAKDADAASLLYAKVCRTMNLAELERRLVLRWALRAQEEGWGGTETRTLHQVVALMMRLALLEFLVPARCPRCNGRKTTWHRASKTDVPCTRCHGRGELPLRESERAAHTGVPMPAWRAKWSSRYRQLQAWLDALCGSAAADLKRVLR